MKKYITPEIEISSLKAADVMLGSDVDMDMDEE